MVFFFVSKERWKSVSEDAETAAAVMREREKQEREQVDHENPTSW